MDFDTYQREAKKTAMYPERLKVTYTTMCLCGEAGELANKVKKVMRGDNQVNKEELAGEMGDILWYLSQLATDLELSFNLVAEGNLQKLRSRSERGVLKGNGDNR